MLYKKFVGLSVVGGVVFHQSIGSGGVCPFDSGWPQKIGHLQGWAQSAYPLPSSREKIRQLHQAR